MVEDFKTRFIRLFALIIKEFHSVWREIGRASCRERV